MPRPAELSRIAQGLRAMALRLSDARERELRLERDLGMRSGWQGWDRSRRKVGRVATGVVYEEPVQIAATADEPALTLRRIEVVLDEPTTDGDTVIRRWGWGRSSRESSFERGESPREPLRTRRIAAKALAFTMRRVASTPAS